MFSAWWTSIIRTLRDQYHYAISEKVLNIVVYIVLRGHNPLLEVLLAVFFGGMHAKNCTFI